jgi:tetratricopeptide (TPR) repeat protein
MPKKIKSSPETILKQKVEVDLTPFRPQTIIPNFTNNIIAWSLFLFSLIVYVITMAKSTAFWDVGEYISTSSILGIPHPPGNPFYIMLGRFFCIFNFGFDHAIMVNFISALFSALAVMFTYLVTVQLISMWNEDKMVVFTGGFVAALLSAFSFSFWNNSIEAEGYSAMAFVVMFCTWLALSWVKKQQGFSHQNTLLLIVYLFFLGFGIHQTCFHLVPAVLFIIVYPYIKDGLKTFSFWGKFVLYIAGLFAVYVIMNGVGENMNNPVLGKFSIGIAIVGILYWYLRGYISTKTWLIGILLCLIGFSTHIFLLVRSELRPFINQGHPHDFDLFMDYILRRQYGTYSFMDRRGTFSEQVNFHFLRYMSWQFLDTEAVSNWFKIPINFIQTISNMLVVCLGLNGFYYAYRKNRNTFWYMFSLFFMTSVAMIFVMNLSGSEVRDRDYFFVTAYNFWAIIMGIGAVGVISSIAKQKALRYVVIVLFLFYPIVNMTSQWHKHDRRGEYIALDYGLNMLNSLERNAIIFTNGDNDTFPLWYIQGVADRKVTEHIYEATDIFPTERTEELIQRGLAWKQTHINGIRQDVVVANLSLLNTPWYLKQLRDMDSIELHWTDEQIDNLRAQIIRNPITYNISSPNGDRFSITHPAGSTMHIRDFAVAQIIRDNFGRRPIYFAVTCSDFAGFDRHLVNEGMVSRVVATSGENRINYERLSNNLHNIFQYRGIFNERLYKDNNMTRLVMNYGAAHLRLSDHYQQSGEFNKALLYFERAMEFILNPSERFRFYGMMAMAYADVGRTNDIERLVHELILHTPDSAHPYVVGALAMFRSDDDDKAFEYLETGLQIDVANRQLISLTLQYGIERNKREEAHRLLSQVSVFVPEVRGFLDRLIDPNVTVNDLF